MFYGTNSIPQSNLHIQSDTWKILCGILSVVHNIVMDLNNVMIVLMTTKHTI